MTRRTKENPPRESLTIEELERLTFDERWKLKPNDVEIARLREINAAKDRERAERSVRLGIEEESILADLREIGFDVKSVWDLVNTSTDYSQAIPVLLKHLLLPYSDVTRDGLARSLAVRDPQVHKAWPILVEQYGGAPMGRGIVGPGDTKEYRLGIRDGLACALVAAVTDETLEELIDLVKDRAQGESRVLLLRALRRRSKKPLVEQALEDVKDDPDLKKEIASWRKRKR